MRTFKEIAYQKLGLTVLFKLVSVQVKGRVLKALSCVYVGLKTSLSIHFYVFPRFRILRYSVHMPAQK